VKIRATTMMKYKGVHGEDLVATRLEIDWADTGLFEDATGLRAYEENEWALLIELMALGARRAGVQFEHRELWNYE